MMNVSLIVVQGKPEGKKIPLAGPVFRIGRAETCHLRPSSVEVSREHAELLISEAGVSIRDLGSRNGTLLNGRALSEVTPVKNGDLVVVGNLTFAVSIQGAPALAAAPVKPAAATAASLDDVSHDQIESWLVADHAHPVPDRPSGVYDGDTLTLTAYQDASKGTAPANSAPANAASAPAPAPVASPSPAAPAAVSAPTPPAPAAPVLPAAAAAAQAAVVATAATQVAVAGFGDLHDIEYEHLPEGEGDPEEELGVASGGDQLAGSVPDEMIDESNPFYAARKALADAAGASEAAKASYKDTSDAATDILRRMMERRRAPRG
jgi:predicted component of type VI protein secretion system